MTADPRAPKTCSLCGVEFTGWGNNPEPVVPFENGQCCDACNGSKVIPARLGLLNKRRGS